MSTLGIRLAYPLAGHDAIARMFRGMTSDDRHDPWEEIMPRLRQVVIDTTNARMSAEFWRQLLAVDVA